jgi:Flp pilus assembly protein TadG
MKIGKHLPRRLRTLPARFVRNRRGLAAIEFAILLPVMLLMYLGAFEITQAIAIKRLVTLTASTVANVVTQYASISQSETMPDILSASETVLQPYPYTNAIVVVSAISIDSSGNATIAWSQSQPAGYARITGSSVTLPAGLDTPSTTLVWGETTYAYTPTVDYLNLGTMDIYSAVYMLPRSSSGTITLTP